MAPSKKKIRPWVRWLVLGIWSATAIAVFASTRIHPSAVINGSLSVSEVSFQTNAKRILGPIDEEQLIVSGVARVEINGSAFKVNINNGSWSEKNHLELTGRSSATCTFYGVHSTGIELKEPSLITLIWPGAETEGSFGIRTHGSLQANLASQASRVNLSPGFSCTRMYAGNPEQDNIEGTFSLAGGDSVYFVTSLDARLDFRAASNFRDTGIPILRALRFSHIEPGSSPEEKTVLLNPPAGGKNELSFEGLEKHIDLNDSDLLVVIPKNEFYLRHFNAMGGIQLSLHGTVSDVKVGAGSLDLRTVMPSLFDHLDSKKRIYGTIPAIVALLVGILEKMGVLRTK